MLTGQRPFQGQAIETLFHKILHEDAVALCRANPALEPAEAGVLAERNRRMPGRATTPVSGSRGP